MATVLLATCRFRLFCCPHLLPTLKRKLVFQFARQTGLANPPTCRGEAIGKHDRAPHVGTRGTEHTKCRHCSNRLLLLILAVSFPLASYDRMLDTRGNTAVYLQFAHARLASILNKARDELHVDLAALMASPEQVSVKHDAERALAFELLVFSDVIEVSYATLAMHCICGGHGQETCR